jgi:hypothetical protein
MGRHILNEPHDFKDSTECLHTLSSEDGNGSSLRHVATFLRILGDGYFLYSGSGAYIQPPIQWVPGVKRQGCEADHSSTTIAEAKKTWIYTSTPLYTFMA